MWLPTSGNQPMKRLICVADDWLAPLLDERKAASEPGPMTCSHIQRRTRPDALLRVAGPRRFGLGLNWRLLAPSGAEMFISFHQRRRRTCVMVPESGIYTLIVGVAADAIGTYGFRIAER